MPDYESSSPELVELPDLEEVYSIEDGEIIIEAHEVPLQTVVDNDEADGDLAAAGNVVTHFLKSRQKLIENVEFGKTVRIIGPSTQSGRPRFRATFTLLTSPDPSKPVGFFLENFGQELSLATGLWQIECTMMSGTQTDKKTKGLKVIIKTG